MKKKILALLLIMTTMLTACSNPLSGLFGKRETQEVKYVLTSVSAEQLQENMFYVKNGDEFFPVHMGETNISKENLIAKEMDPSRIISFTKDDVMIPTMYKDDTLIYYTKQSVPTFYWERLKDYGYTVGLYNLSAAESNKIQFVVGESKTDHGSDAYAGLSQLDIGDSVIIIDKVGGQTVTGERLSECGSINGLKADEMANIDLYIGTQHYLIESKVDTHVLSSMEIYQTNEYNLMPEGYASVKIPEYFLSGYYFINGVGVIRYVANNRSEGVANVDFSVPYFYEDEFGNQITLEEYEALKGNKSEEENKESDYKFSYNIDSTVKSLKLSLKYDLLEGEDINDVLYEAPSAKIVSPVGDETEFQSTVEEGKQVLTTTINGVMSGKWDVYVYDLGERKFSVDSEIESGNADSFVHSGNSEGTFTIYSDGVSGYGVAKVKWENATRAASISIKSPSGIVYNDVDNKDLLIKDGYGEKELLINGVEAGNWELTINGEELGRCWFTITKQDETALPETPDIQETQEEIQEETQETGESIEETQNTENE